MGCVLSDYPTEQLSAELPKVNINVGVAVKPLEQFKTHKSRRLIFIFGGPGSRKGRIVNDLTNGFGLYVISVEKLLFSYLLHTENLDQTKTRQMELLLRSNSGVISLELVFNLLDKSIKSGLSTGYKGIFLIDLVPNLRSMINTRVFENKCTRLLRKFEEQWPCLFALNLEAADGGADLQALAQRSSSTRMLRDGVSDEKDVQKTKKRYDEYVQSTSEFLAYFSSENRLVTVDVSCGISDLIWATVADFFYNMGIKPLRTLNTVVLFLLKKEHQPPENLAAYRMETLDLSDLLDNSKTNISLNHVFTEISNRIEQSKVTCEYFVVPLSSFDITDMIKTQKMREIFFFDEMELHRFIYTGVVLSDQNNRQTKKTSLLRFLKRNVPDKGTFSTTYKAVSTTHNEVCMFLDDVDTTLCRQITLLYVQARRKHFRRQTSNIGSFASSTQSDL